ncbi:MAG: oxidoreductase [Acetobacteraceae bacterium]|nr:oxidoreductase [Acetobacteraceae bacterium]
MRALVTTPNGKASVEMRDVPEPAPAPNEALIAVHAFSLNRGELRSVINNGEGWIPGQDVSGVVLRQAANGSGPAAGTRVVALTDEFGWAEQVAVPAHRVVPLPGNVSFAQAAALPVAGLTALRCVRLGGALAGRRVLITGAAGGVGTLAIQIAAHSGAHVTAVVGAPERAAGIAGLGARDTVHGIENAAGRYALILESAGGTSLSEALKRVEPSGIIAVYGNSSGERSEIGFMDFRPAQNARIQSFFYFTSGPEEMFAPDLALLVALVADGNLRPVIGAERDWADFAEVAETLRSRQVAGKAVFRTGVA